MKKDECDHIIQVQARMIGGKKPHLELIFESSKRDFKNCFDVFIPGYCALCGERINEIK